ncbi:MAG: hypothetical protein JEZ07_09170 [Phycisphaerae bacterium]|nr:hypothetical protein [Phycisphaerae bacterium]
MLKKIKTPIITSNITGTKVNNEKISDTTDFLNPEQQRAWEFLTDELKTRFDEYCNSIESLNPIDKSLMLDEPRLLRWMDGGCEQPFEVPRATDEAHYNASIMRLHDAIGKNLTDLVSMWNFNEQHYNQNTVRHFELLTLSFVRELLRIADLLNQEGYTVKLQQLQWYLSTCIWDTNDGSDGKSEDNKEIK